MGTKRPVKKGNLDSLGREISYKQPEESATTFDAEEYLNDLSDSYDSSDELLDDFDTSWHQMTDRPIDYLTMDEREAVYNTASEATELRREAELELLDNLPDEKIQVFHVAGIDDEVEMRNLWNAYKGFELPDSIVDKAKLEWDANRLFAETDGLSDGVDEEVARMAEGQIYQIIGVYDDEDLSHAFRGLMRLTQASYHVEELDGTPHATSMKLTAKEMEYHEAKHSEYSDQFNSLNREFDKLLANPDTQPTEEMGQDMYDAAQKALAAHSAYLVAKEKMDTYQTAAAALAGQISGMADRRGMFPELDVDSFGSLHAVGNFESGSEEWLRLRTEGIGMSDMNTLFAKNNPHRDHNLEEMWQAKVNGVIRPEKQSVLPETATGRGHMWETTIGVMFAANNPELAGQIVRDKRTFRSSEGNTQVNFDFLISGGEGKPPAGVLEIKTSSTPGNWGSSGGGIDDIDQKYRAQLLGQMLEAGVDTGHMAVMINGHDYRDYKVTMTDELRAEAMENRRKANLIYDAMKQARDLPPEERATAPLAELKALAGHTVRSAPGDFPAAALTPGSNNQAKQAIFNHVGIGMGKDAAYVKERFDEIMGPAESYKPKRGASAEEKRAAQEKVKDGFRQLYREIDFSSRPVIGIDLETTGSGPTKGRIIEAGYVVTDMKSGRTIATDGILYDAPKADLRAAERSGALAVSGITESELTGKRTFRENAGSLDAILRSYAEDPDDPKSQHVRPLIVAHNASVEKGFLRANLFDFARAEARGEIQVFDTMMLTRRMIPEAKNASMSEFARTQGVEYENAHRARQDADMMVRALKNYNDRIHGDS